MKKDNSKIKGFTLVELLIAVSLIAILSGVLLSVLNPIGIQKKTRDAQRISDLAKIKVALEGYFSDNRKYPNINFADTWTAVAETNGGGAALPAGELTTSYINVLPNDPKPTGNDCTGRGYFYKTDTNGTTYVLAAVLEITPVTAYSCPTSLPAGFCDGCRGDAVYYTTAE